MKRQFKQEWSTIPPISTKRTITTQHSLIEQNKDTTHDVGNTGHGLRQEHQCGGVKPVNGSPPLDN
jgi:hypothetical protein